MLVPLLLLLATAGAAGYRFSVARPTSQHRAASAVMQAGGEALELPLFDPLKDELPFPFPRPMAANALSDEEEMPPSTYRYAFDRPSHIRMLREADGDDRLFGHLVLAGKGEAVNSLMLGSDTLVRAGTAGVALRLSSVEFSDMGGGDATAAPFAFGGGEGGEVAIAAVEGAFRFVIEEVTQTIPYPVASVRQLCDTPLDEADEAARARTAALEASVTASLERLVDLSRQLEAKGVAAEAAEAALAAPAALLASHEQAVLGASYASVDERWEIFSLAACEVVALPYADAVEALATTDSCRRFELLLAALEPAVAEMATLATIDSIDGLSGLGGLGIDSLDGLAGEDLPWPSTGLPRPSETFHGVPPTVYGLPWPSPAFHALPLTVHDLPLTFH